MHRRDELTTEQFAKIAHLLPGREGHVGVTAQDNHKFLNAVFWILKTGAPWRAL
ncbi:MAG: transposase, partial [Bacteroidota bacterium]